MSWPQNSLLHRLRSADNVFLISILSRASAFAVQTALLHNHFRGTLDITIHRALLLLPRCFHVLIALLNSNS